MKQDSYPRFLKSELYKQCIIAEMEGLPLPYPDEEETKPLGTSENALDPSNKKVFDWSPFSDSLLSVSLFSVFHCFCAEHEEEQVLSCSC